MLTGQPEASVPVRATGFFLAKIQVDSKANKMFNGGLCQSKGDYRVTLLSR